MIPVNSQHQLYPPQGYQLEPTQSSRSTERTQMAQHCHTQVRHLDPRPRHSQNPTQRSRSAQVSPFGSQVLQPQLWVNSQRPQGYQPPNPFQLQQLYTSQVSSRSPTPRGYQPHTHQYPGATGTQTEQQRHTQMSQPQLWVNSQRPQGNQPNSQVQRQQPYDTLYGQPHHQVNSQQELYPPQGYQPEPTQRSSSTPPPTRLVSVIFDGSNFEHSVFVSEGRCHYKQCMEALRKTMDHFKTMYPEHDVRGFWVDGNSEAYLTYVNQNVIGQKKEELTRTALERIKYYRGCMNSVSGYNKDVSLFEVGKMKSQSGFVDGMRRAEVWVQSAVDSFVICKAIEQYVEDKVEEVILFTGDGDVVPVFDLCNGPLRHSLRKPPLRLGVTRQGGVSEDFSRNQGIGNRLGGSDPILLYAIPALSTFFRQGSDRGRHPRPRNRSRHRCRSPKVSGSCIPSQQQKNIPGQGPGMQQLTSAALAAMSSEELKNALGERLYARIYAVNPEQAAKITGMLLEMDTTEILNVLEDDGVLRNKIDEALTVLRAHQDK